MNSCINSNSKNDQGKKSELLNNSIDSIEISVKLPPKSGCGFSISDKYHNYQFCSFENKSNKDTVITNRYQYSLKAPIVMYSMIMENDYIYHDYIIKRTNVKLNFTLKNGDVTLINTDNVIIADELFASYDINLINFFEKKKTFKLTKNYLDSLYNYFNKKYSQEYQPELIKLNKIRYIEKLQSIDPFNKEVEKFVRRSGHKDYILNYTTQIFKSYLKTRIEKMSFDSLNNENYTPETLELFAIAMYQLFQGDDKSIRPNKYPNAKEWLITTEFYAKNREEIDKVISPIEKKEFKNRLSNLALLDKEFSPIKFIDVIQENPSDYYLLDFWATWCKPCLEGIQTIHKMEIPKNIIVINLGTDKSNHQEAWKKKAIATGQKVSYLIDLSINENKEFLKFIELNSIPRYILIDNNMNIIDEAFNHPHDPEFLNILNNIKSFYKK